MTIRRASLLLPCARLADFPTHLSGDSATELLVAWTALWHPALISVTGGLPGWHSTDEPPNPSSLESELILAPSLCKQRLPSDWCERFRETFPRNPPLVEAATSRDETIAAALVAASADAHSFADSIVRDFLALGYAHLQVELMTRAMHYSTVLDSAQFSNAVVEAAAAAAARDNTKARDELGRAFDLLMDARNHVYSVDFYVVDVTLLASSTLDEPLRAKLADGFPTSLLATGELIERLADNHPETLAVLRLGLDEGTACVFGGAMHAGPTAGRSPEAILAEFLAGRNVAQQKLSRSLEVFGQFDSAYSPLLPEILHGCGFSGALHAAFDGGPFPKAEQRKTRWGSRDGAQIDALSATPLDVARPETWLQFAERVSDTIAHDHVATILLAGWPGHACEFHDDLRRAAEYGTVLGKPVTLEEYFRVTREIDDWSAFHPIEYAKQPPEDGVANSISSRVESLSRDIDATRDLLVEGLNQIALANSARNSTTPSEVPVVINPWNSAGEMVIGFDPRVEPSAKVGDLVCVGSVPGCGYAVLEKHIASPSPAPLAEGYKLRNEYLEVVIHQDSGGIQSMKRHSDRRTRLSQRLVMHDERVARIFADANREIEDRPRLETTMHAEVVEITHSDDFAGEITSRGHLLDAAGDLLARFTQSVRLVRRFPVAFIDIELDVARLPEGDIWSSYIANRIVWGDDAISVRRGAEWVGRSTNRTHIVSPEWIQISTEDGRVTCCALGLPFHRLASNSWLDTLLLVEGEEQRKFRFALGVDNNYPSQLALSVATCGHAPVSFWPNRPSTPTGWLLHISSKNVLITHAAPNMGERPGFRVRLLETEGRSSSFKLSAFRPIRAAISTDFLGQSTSLLSVVDGNLRLDIGSHQWMQIEAEFDTLGNSAGLGPNTSLAASASRRSPT